MNLNRSARLLFGNIARIEGHKSLVITTRSPFANGSMTYEFELDVYGNIIHNEQVMGPDAAIAFFETMVNCELEIYLTAVTDKIVSIKRKSRPAKAPIKRVYCLCVKHGCTSAVPASTVCRGMIEAGEIDDSNEAEYEFIEPLILNEELH